jgi:hypothetical protein
MAPLHHHYQRGYESKIVTRFWIVAIMLRFFLDYYSKIKYMRLVVLGGGESGVGTAILGEERDYLLCLILEKLKINTRKTL